MALAGVLWDNDGVLVDTERLFYQANRELFLRFGVDLSERQFFDWYLADNCGAWHLLTTLQLTNKQMDDLRGERNVRYAQLLAGANVQPVAGVEPVLAAWSSRLPMAVVTSCNGDHFQQIHAKLGLLKHFRFALTSEHYVNSKPSPEPYCLGLERLGVAASDCVVVEDSPRGLQAALGAGLRCIVLRHPLTRHYDFPGAWRVVDHMGELHEELLALGH
ncbi:HAD family phosphatase [Pseudoduganella ginsengisoli]|uniref:phosphoglycolate phosphatase n=2 Tax=Pseudoduganella ginsengisoli TaxID=1462440 RepID=A0A6L6Q739_9BURK|nr:HAD-IA family hydrolase [Pseudoduganella ginsengisoli]